MNDEKSQGSPNEDKYSNERDEVDREVEDDDDNGM